MDFYRYFQSYKEYFWNWEENGEVLSIPNGSTIAYREFLLQILQNLSNQGIPPFGSLLLVIVATNNTSENSLAQINNLISDLISHQEDLTKHKNELATLEKTISFLNILSSLPKQYKEGKLRLYLLQTLFASCHNILAQNTSKRIIREFSNKFYEKERLISPNKINMGALHRDFWTVGLLQRKFPDTKSIINAIANIPDIGEEIKLQETGSPETFKNDFVQELINNPKTFHLGSLIKRIWTGLKIPYHHTLPSELPLGGISDLTNKGDFDKLLISEFANDDLILLSRLANNEALYLNREMPPVSDITQRMVLIDVSIKNWGTPKVLAYAILLAIAKHPKTNIKCVAFAIGNAYYPITFSTIDEIIESLAILDSSLHSASGLEIFFKTNANPKLLEIFFISSKETLILPAMQNILSKFNNYFKYIITTSSNGDIELYKNYNKSKKLLQNLHLNLNDIWQTAIKTPILQGVTTYPILFPRQSIFKILNTPHNELFVITNSKKIFKVATNDLTTNKKGLEEIWTNLPHGEYEIGTTENGDNILLCYNPQVKELMFINLTSKDIKKLAFTDKKPNNNHFFFFNENFHFISLTNHWIIKYGSDLELLKNNIISEQIFNASQKRNQELRGLYFRNPTTLLKNIGCIFINNVNNLVFNIHELTLNSDGIFKIEKTEFLQKKIIANLVKKNEFVFFDGSAILTNRSGIVTLISSNKDIPNIYIPTALDMPLGIGTEQYFAGNDYFYKETNILKTGTKLFWKNHIEKFILNIQLNATQDKAIS